jgi:hypothetical protein
MTILEVAGDPTKKQLLSVTIRFSGQDGTVGDIESDVMNSTEGPRVVSATTNFGQSDGGIGSSFCLKPGLVVKGAVRVHRDAEEDPCELNVAVRGSKKKR